MIASVAANPLAGRLVWEFFVERFDKVNAVFNTGGQAFLISAIVDDVASTGTTQEDVRRRRRSPPGLCRHLLTGRCAFWWVGWAPQLERVRSFFAQHPLPAADRAIRSSLERIRIRGKRIATEGPQLAAWLQQRYGA